VEILYLILLILLNQYFPIIGDTSVLIEVFGLLAIFWADIVLSMTISVLLIAILFLPRIYKRTRSLGIYHKLASDSYPRGENYQEKTRKVLSSNIIVGFLLFCTMVYVLNSVPLTFLQPTVNETSTVDENIILNKLPTTAFTLTLISVPVFLLGIRVFANPTRIFVQYFLTFIDYQNSSDDELLKQVQNFKGEVLSFYYSFILGTLILFYFSFSLHVIMYNLDILSIFSPFFPKLDLYSIIFFVVCEVIVISITTLFGELYLKKYEPIDQI